MSDRLWLLGVYERAFRDDDLVTCAIANHAMYGVGTIHRDNVPTLDSDAPERIHGMTAAQALAYCERRNR